MLTGVDLKSVPESPSSCDQKGSGLVQRHESQLVPRLSVCACSTSAAAQGTDSFMTFNGLKPSESFEDRLGMAGGATSNQTEPQMSKVLQKLLNS